MGGPEIEELIALFSRLPGLGPRSARRVVLSLLRQPAHKMLPLAQALERTARSVKTCRLCGNIDVHDPCAICSGPGRDQSVICVVETVADLWALERAGVHRGLYHVLGGTLSALSGIGPDDLNVASLLKRLESGGVKEVIVALGATVDGATTMHWLCERLQRFDIVISRIGQGMPMGGALDVLDDGTLFAALTARRPVEEQT